MPIILWSLKPGKAAAVASATACANLLLASAYNY
jgi:hypothetical protein